MMRFAVAMIAWVLWVPVATMADPLADPREDSDALASSESCLDHAIEAIQHRYDAVDDLRADFQQVTRTAALPGSGTSTSGTVSFAKPGKMRWTYADPPSLLVSDGKTLWIYDPSFNEVQRLAASGEYLSGASIQFLLGRGDIRRDFTISEKSCSADSIEIELRPIQPASFERLEIVADPRSGDLTRTTIFDLIGNVTEVTFSNLETDLHPPPETFRFEPPEGAKVLDVGGKPQ